MADDEQARRLRTLMAEHTARFDSIDEQLRSLTELVGQVLARMPEEPEAG